MKLGSKPLNTDLFCGIFVFSAVALLVVLNGGMSWHHCIIPTLLFVTAAILKKVRSVGIATDALVFVAVITVLLSSAFSMTDKSEALHESFKIICFASAIYAGKALSRNTLLKIIAAAGVFIALAGILSYCNIVRAPEFVFDDRGMLRLQSFLKYANTTAAFLASSYFCINELQFKSHRIRRLLSMIVLSALYLTVSKAGIPVFLAVGTVYIIFNKDRASDFLVQNTVSALFFVPAILLASSYMYAQCLLLTVCWINLGAVVSAKAKYSKKLLTAWVAAAIAAPVMIILISAFGKIDLLSTLMYRLSYASDSLSLWNKGILGTGPASWRFLQYSVQQSQYSVTYIHNGWLQFFVENGIVFFGAFIGIFSYSLYKAFRKREWAYCAILTFLGLHSLIDIDFGFTVILAIMGLVCGNTHEGSKKAPITTVILAIGIAFSGYLTAEYFARTRFENAYIQEDYERAEEYALSLKKLCPYDSYLHYNLAILTNSRERLEDAVSLNPYDINLLEKLIEFSVSTKTADTLSLCKRYINLAPHQEDTYTKIKQFAGQAFKYQLCTEEEYLEFTALAEKRMEDEGVIDRDKLLNDISKRKD